MKVRKPRNIHHGYGFFCVANAGLLQIIATPVASVARLREIYVWLGRYIAWREQEDAK